MGRWEFFRSFVRNLARIFRVAWKANGAWLAIYACIIIVASIFPVALSYTYKLVLDRVVAAQSLGGIVTIAIVSAFAFRYIVMLISDAVGTFRDSYLESVLRERFENQLILDFVSTMAAMDIPHLENHETQSLIAKAQQAYPWRLTNFFMFAIYSAMFIFSFIAAFIALVPYGAWIPFVMFLAVLPRVFFEKKYVELTWSRFNDSIDERKELTYLRGVLEGRANLREIRIAQAAPALISRIRKLLDFFFHLANKPRQRYLPRLIIGIVIETVAIAGLAYLKIPSAAAGIITVGSLTFYFTMLDRMSSNVERIASQSAKLFEQNLYVGYYFDVLDLKPVIAQKVPGVAFGEVAPPRIEFRNVHFGYDPDKEVIGGVSFTLEPGEHLAIVGPNGAGKTTLINLLLRFYDPTAGEVYVNDYDLRDLRLENWYQFVGVLFQNFVQFNLTVRDNILLGDPTKIDDEKMRDAARKAGAAEFIEEFPLQYDQPLGRRYENSKELSRGQWQRLALARAFYEAAPVLVLDEPTSAIDADAEAEIFENLYGVYRDRSLVVVSHRFSTVRNADKIIVLKDGVIAEQGNHKELMALNGTYASMFRKQAKGYLE